MPYDAPTPDVPPKTPIPLGGLLAVVAVCFLALACILGAGFGVWLAL